VRRAVRILTRLSLAAAAVALVIWAFRPVPVEVDLGVVTHGDLVVTVDHEGKTRVKERYVVSSPLSGRLLRVKLRPGDPVVARQTLLAVIEPADPQLLDVRAIALAEARVEAAKAAREKASAELDRAKVLLSQEQGELERVRKLRARQTATEREYEIATYRERAAASDVRSADFAVQVADFELKQAEAALILTRPGSPGAAESFRFEIPSPVSGVVLRVFRESATIVEPGTSLLEVGDPGELECEVDVLSTDAVKISPGQRVEIGYWGGDHPLAGRVRVREPSAFTKVSALGVEEQRVNIIIDLTDPPAARQTLGDGYRVEARVVVWEGRGVLKAPAGALFRRGDRWAVFAVVNRSAVLRQVEIGHSDGIETEVLNGLAEGDRVVLHPTDRVEDGAAVEAR
jgi:HlyD family secretion protein